MPTIIFIQHDGSEQRVEAEVGQSLMQVALNNRVPGILGDCGGNCSCATCHGYIERAEWDAQIPEAQAYERDMLSCASEVTENSRLTCQVIVSPALDGLVVRLPASQY